MVSVSAWLIEPWVLCIPWISWPIFRSSHVAVSLSPRLSFVESPKCKVSDFPLLSKRVMVLASLSIAVIFPKNSDDAAAAGAGDDDVGGYGAGSTAINVPAMAIEAIAPNGISFVFMANLRIAFRPQKDVS